MDSTTTRESAGSTAADVSGNGSRPVHLTSRNPRTGEVVGTFDNMDAGRVDGLVERARELQPQWARLSPAERGRHLLRIRASLVDAGPEITRVSAEETGKPIATAYYELMAACTMLTWAAKNVDEALRPHRLPSYPLVAKRVHMEYDPFGVVGLITPWNYPIGIPFQMIPYVLGAGNTIVLKPSELATLTGIRIGTAINAAGRELVQVVTGDGQAGEAVVRAPVDKIAFTGGGATARHILRAAADSLTPVILELGGKDPMIVTPDADPETAARAATAAAFFNAGQTCMATERAIVCEPIHDEFVRRCALIADELRIGPDEDSQVGPLTRAEALPVLEARIADAVAKGARIIAGGSRAEGLGHGTYLRPTVLDNVTPDMDLFHMESFGPILAVVRAQDTAEAVRLANETDMGLTASVLTADPELGREVASQVEAGGVNVNDVMLGAAMAAVPFGGIKQSGFGRLQGVEGFRAFSRSKAVTENRVARMKPTISMMFHNNRQPSPKMLQRALKLMFGRGR